MQLALNSRGETLYAQTLPAAKDRQSAYYCPQCLQAVYLKQSRRGKPFFSHYQACQTARRKQRQRPIESQEHQTAKELFLKLSSPWQIHSEYYLPEIQQTADIYLEDCQAGRKVIVEFQHSPIPARELAQRHKAYLTQVPAVYWLMNYRFLIENQGRKEWLWRMLQFNSADRYYCLALDLERGEVVKWHRIKMLHRKQAFHYQESRYSLDAFLSGGAPYRTQSCCRQQKVANRHDKDYQRLLWELRQNQSYQEEIQALYTAGSRLSDFPQLLLTQELQLEYCQGASIWQIIWAYQAVLELPACFQFNDFLFKIRQCPYIKLRPFPLISSDFQRLLAETFLQIFCQMDLLKQAGSSSTGSYCKRLPKKIEV